MAGKPQTLTKGQEDHVIRILRKKLLAWVLICFAILAGLTGASLWGIMRRAEAKMKTMVAQQFEEPRIQHVVRQVAANRASFLMSNQISPQVAKFKSDIANELQEAQSLVDKTRALEAEGQKHRASIVGIVSNLEHIATRARIAEERLTTVETNLILASSTLEGLNTKLTDFDQRFEKVTEEQEFLSVANRARLYSLESFNKLQTISRSTNIYAADAKQLVWSLRRQMDLDRKQGTEYVPIEQAGEYVYKGPFTAEEIADRLRTRAGVEGGANLARKEKLNTFIPQLVAMSKDERNLWVQNRITYSISTLAKEDFMPWETSRLERWWDEHGSSYTNWPYSSYDRALNYISKGRYAQALDQLKKIVEKYPRADKSRALALACACETGDTNTIHKLDSSWKFPKARWAEWARIKMSLSTGAVESATADLANLSLKYKSFTSKAYIAPGNHIWHKINWERYSELLREDKSEKPNKAIDSDKK